jgi:hypothetical protein
LADKLLHSSRRVKATVDEPVITGEEQKKAWDKYYQLAGEMGTAVEKYIEDHTEKGAQRETEGVERYKLWKVLMQIGEMAAQDVQSDVSLCAIIFDYLRMD